MKCPVCGSKDFYVKNPDDAFEVHAFALEEGKVIFQDEGEAEDAPDVGEATETYCDSCSWHGKLGSLKQGR